MEPTVASGAALPPAVQPCAEEPAGQPTVFVVRTARGWSVLQPEEPTGWVGVDHGHPADADELSLVEAMSLADLVSAELGGRPEPDREARRAARTATGRPGEETGAAEPRDEEIAALRRTIAQLEHALATRVSVEQAIGVLAERHGTTPREAFEELRRRARSQGRPAHELAAEVLDGLATWSPVLGRRHALANGDPGPALIPAPDTCPAGGGQPPRRVQRTEHRADGGAVPEARH